MSKRSTGTFLWVGTTLTILASVGGFGAVVGGADPSLFFLVLIGAVAGLVALAVGISQVGETVDLIHSTLLARQTPPEEPEPPSIDADHVMGL